MSDITDKLLDRRGFLHLIVAAGALSGAIACSSPSVAYAQSASRQNPRQTQPSLEELARKWKMPLSRVQEIAREMKQPVEQTLKGYATFVCHDSYDREVFQRHLPPSQRKAALVFFYVGHGPSRGLASVLRQLVIEYGNKVKFLGYNLDCDAWSREGRRYRIRQAYDIRAPPSTAMYGLFDLLKGETMDNNDGKIKRIDTLRGGFSTSNINSWITYYKGCTDWINTNLFNTNNFVYRLQSAGSKYARGPPKKIFLNR